MPELHPMQLQSDHIRLYESLLLSSSKLLEWAQGVDWDDHILAKGASLQQEWSDLQHQIIDLERNIMKSGTKLSDLPYANELLPLAKKIQRTQQRTELILSDAMGTVGKSLKGLQDNKHLTRAYNDAGQGNPIALFFDEKK